MLINLMGLCAKVCKTSFQDLTGQKFNRLKVLELSDKKNNQNRVLWKCECECGNIKYLSSHTLKSNNTKSCGCYLRERLKQKGPNARHALPIGQSLINLIYRGYKNRCKKENITLEISIGEATKIFLSPCYYCGCPPSRKRTNKGYIGEILWNGIDRIDNMLGYINGNCAPCCRRCNTAKSNMTLSEFKQWICTIYNNLENI